MAKTRLNNADREAIGDAIIEHKYGPMAEELVAREATLADEIYKRIYPRSVLKAMMQALGDGAFENDSDLTINVNGKKILLTFAGATWAVGVPTPEGRKHEYRILKHTHINNPVLNVHDDDELGARVVQWAQDREEFKKDKPAMRDKLRATLQSYVYFDDLLTAFPQAEAFIMKRWRERPEGGSPGVPAVEIKSLAAQLDLPPVTTKKAA